MKKYKIELHEQARIDIRNAAFYYEEQVKGLGNKFISKVRNAQTY